MDGLSIAASVYSVLQLTGAVIEYLNDVTSAPKECAQCTTELCNVQGLLVQLRYHLGERTSDDPWYKATAELGAPEGALAQYKDALDHLRSKLEHRSGIRKALSWSFTKDEVSNTLLRIERLKSHTQLALQMDHLKLSQAIKDDTSMLKANTESIKTDTVEIRNKMEQESEAWQHDEVMDWISSVQYDTMLHDLISKKQDGTLAWFTSSSEFTDWIATNGETLFCPGIPGAGKTFVAATAIDYLHVHDRNVGIGYVFCQYKLDDQSAEDIIAAIIKQLIGNRPSFAEPVRLLHKKYASKGLRPSLNDLVAALSSAIANYSQTFIVIDALDEWKDKNGSNNRLIRTLLEIQTQTKINLMITSRFDGAIKEQLCGARKLEILARQLDIENYATGRLCDLPRCVQGDQTLQKEVKAQVAQATDGMQKLRQLPKGCAGLDDAYKEAVGRIQNQPEEQRELARKVICWISHARRMLSPDELRYALAVEPGVNDIDKENVLHSVDLVSVCAGLVSIDEESNIIRLVHYTTQEYFQRVRNDWYPQAELEITTTCLQYLSLRAFRNDSLFPPRPADYGCLYGLMKAKRDDDLRAQSSHILAHHAFLDYAACNWGYHGSDIQEEISELALTVAASSTIIGIWALIIWFKADSIAWKLHRNEPERMDMHAAHLLAWFGLDKLLARIMANNSSHYETIRTDSLGNTILHYAMVNGQDAVANFLLSHVDVDINAANAYGDAPIHLAACGSTSCVRTLIDQGADLECLSGFGTPLCRAASEGHNAIVELLLDRGANIEADNGEHGTPLFQAADSGHEAIIKLLLDRGANIEAEYALCGTSLCQAADRGYEAIVKLLLDRGANIEVQGSLGTPLHSAIYKDHKSIAQLLLDRGANIEAQTEKSKETSLHFATKHGRESLIQLLLDRGANIEAQDNFGTPLHCAVRKRYTSMVKLLLDRDADTSTKDRHGRTPLSLAKTAESLCQSELKKIELGTKRPTPYSNRCLLRIDAREYQMVVEILLKAGAQEDFNVEEALNETFKNEEESGWSDTDSGITDYTENEGSEEALHEERSGREANRGLGTLDTDPPERLKEIRYQIEKLKRDELCEYNLPLEWDREEGNGSSQAGGELSHPSTACMKSAFAVARAKRERQEPNATRILDEEISSANVSEVHPPLSIDQDNFPESTSSSQSELETDVNDGVQRTKAEPFTTWEPSDGTVQRVDDGAIVFMRNGDKITLLGQYGLQVRDGEVHIYGAVLKKSEAIYLVSCPTTHALPSLSCGSGAAKIRITRCSQSIRNLGTLSPLFRNIWDHHRSISTTANFCTARDGFSFIPSSRKDTFGKNMFPLFLSPERAAITQKVCEMENGRVPIILVCDAKSTGKSTLGRMILNRLITTRPSHKPERNFSHQPVFFLDLDPAQPEFGPPGLISLIQIRRPILGPPFAHVDTTVTPNIRLIRAHTLTALSPNEDPVHFLQAANQLMQEYHHALARAPGIPLVIDYPSWATGLGLDTLVQFIEKWTPSDVVHLDSGHEGDAVASLTQVAGNNFVHSLRLPEFRATMRTSAQLATMQAISYFHSKGVASDESMRWNSVPLAEWKPWIVRYGEQSPGILGLMLYGENIAPEFLRTVFDGNLVSMVVLEDESALAVPQIFHKSGSEVDDNANNEACQSVDLKGSPTTQGLSHSQSSQWPCLRRTPKENLPHILTGDYGYTTPLDPCNSYAIGQALIRDIDVEQQILYLVTPVSRSIIENLPKNRKTRSPNIVLVRGRWEAPRWVLKEDSPWGSSRGARWSEERESAVGNESRPAGGGEDVNGSDVIMTDGDHGPLS
ncbi:MAG: hypothetical protein M1821_004274 [Bathelium mastoideum]|nr:MAG: hypothetical protein M1821_004274 [Bathelium mastoideum]